MDLQRRSRQIQRTLSKQIRLTGSQGTTQRAFAHARRGMKPEMLWCQVVRPNEQGWRGDEGESEREDALYMCTLQLPTREKSCCEEVRGGIERASGCIGFRAEMNSGPEARSDQVHVPNRAPKELWNHDEGRGGRRVQEGLCPSRHNVHCCCQFGIFFHKMSWVGGGGGGKNQSGTAPEPISVENVGTLLGPKMR